MDCVPFESAAITAYPSKAAWDAATAELVGTMLERWHLTAVHGLGGGFAASALEVMQADGTVAVLKIGYPHTEAIGEAVALEAYGPGLAPRVIRQDPWTWSMLLAEVVPGRPLSALPVDEALAVAADLVDRMRAVAVPAGIPALSAEVREFIAAAVARRPREARLLRELHVEPLVDRAFAIAEQLCSTPVGNTLVHGDLNPSNVLEGADGRWLVIDPKPMAGDAAYDIGPLVGQLGELFSSADRTTELVRRVGSIAASTGLPVDRVTRWCFVRAALSLCWLIDDGLEREAARAAAELIAWSRAPALSSVTAVPGVAATAPTGQRHWPRRH